MKLIKEVKHELYFLHYTIAWDGITFSIPSTTQVPFLIKRSCQQLPLSTIEVFGLITWIPMQESFNCNVQSMVLWILDLEFACGGLCDTLVHLSAKVGTRYNKVYPFPCNPNPFIGTRISKLTLYPSSFANNYSTNPERLHYIFTISTISIHSISSNSPRLCFPAYINTHILSSVPKLFGTGFATCK